MKKGFESKHPGKDDRLVAESGKAIRQIDESR
jgi:hypothetical protein